MFEVCHVLFLEDYKIIREHFVKGMLSIDAKSFVFHEVATYKEAIEVAKKTKIDIFILDVHLHDMKEREAFKYYPTGIDFARTLRKESKVAVVKKETWLSKVFKRKETYPYDYTHSLIIFQSCSSNYEREMKQVGYMGLLNKTNTPINAYEELLCARNELQV